MPKTPHRRVSDETTRLYTVSQIAVLLSVSERTIRRWLDNVYDMSVSRAGPRKHLYTLTTVRQIAAAHLRVLDMSMTSPGHDVMDSLADQSRTEQLEEVVLELSRQVQDIVRRLVRLETDWSRTQVPRLRVPLERAALPIRPSAPETADDDLSELGAHFSGLPRSRRGQARWVALRGGPKWATVRDYEDCGSWQSPEEAITAVRRHRGWEAWIPAY